MIKRLLYFLGIKKKHDYVIKRIISNGRVIGFNYFYLGKYLYSFVNNKQRKLKGIKDLY